MKTAENPDIGNLIEIENAELFQEERSERRSKEAIAEIQQENRKCYNRKRKIPNKYKVNDLVTIMQTQGGGLKYLGPYRIKSFKKRQICRGKDRSDEGTSSGRLHETLKRHA